MNGGARITCVGCGVSMELPAFIYSHEFAPRRIDGMPVETGRVRSVQFEFCADCNGGYVAVDTLNEMLFGIEPDGLTLALRRRAG